MRTAFVSVLSILLMGINNGIQLVDINMLVTVYILASSIALILDLYHSRRLHAFEMPIIAGYVWRLFLMLFDMYGKNIYRLPNSGTDTENFYHGAVQIARNGWPGGVSFQSVMGMIFRLTGESRLLGQYICILFSIIAICALIFAVVELNHISLRDIKRILWIVCLLPNYAILSSVFLRESIVSMFMTLSICCFVLWFMRKRELYFVMAIVCSLAGAVFHSGSVALVGGYIVVRLIYDNRTERITTNIKTIFAAVVLGSLFIFLFTNYGDIFFSKMAGIRNIGDIADESGMGGSAYTQYVGDSSSVRNMIIYTIPRVVFFLFSPFPWQWRGLADVIAFTFSSMFYLIVIVRVIRSLRVSRQNKTLLILIIVVTFASLFVFGWGVDNVGTAARHREKLFLIFALLDIVALTDDETRYIRRR